MMIRVNNVWLKLMGIVAHEVKSRVTIIVSLFPSKSQYFPVNPSISREIPVFPTVLGNTSISREIANPGIQPGVYRTVLFGFL